MSYKSATEVSDIRSHATARPAHVLLFPAKSGDKKFPHSYHECSVGQAICMGLYHVYLLHLEVAALVASVHRMRAG